MRPVPRRDQRAIDWEQARAYGSYDWKPKSRKRRARKHLPRKRTGTHAFHRDEDGRAYYHRYVPGLWRLRRRVERLRRSRIAPVKDV